ncbi:maleylpyruvate isomerase family mycothiol-dependent enzyme [Streptomyces sp. SID8379]|uniref:maleylpyruvate isomerase family mycothiol-dependent enzyme n=1 Tax=unclassified Streptomyces TaxID=2593676 RepID=UPI000366BC9E|nr:MULTISPECIES: maleylpyruvate isomerase family mycothiol-dependent enzyme [unclassified Streptomyces]MYW66576.1 maleylpyruvate isomerase family mycothiol-dependent enzyme [Streptomyces sp. SID8379]
MTPDAYDHEPDHAPDHASVRELLGAWAVHALPPDEQRLVPPHLADCATCAAEAERLRETVRILDGPDTEALASVASASSASSASSVSSVAPHRRTAMNETLTRALAQRPPVPRATTPHAEPYAAAVAALQALLAEADAGTWQTLVIHGWTVQDTVAHLIAADEHLAARLGLPPSAPSASPDPQGDTAWRTEWASRTHRVITHERGRAPAETVATWRAQAAALLGTEAARDPELAARAAVLLGIRLPVADHFLIRAFETWIHADDIGRALRRPVPPPPAAHLWRLVRLAVRILGLALGPQAPPVALTVTDETRSTEWILGSEDEPVRGELALDPVDFCLLIGGRAAADAVPRGTGGDPRAVQAVLDRAARLAWL